MSSRQQNFIITALYYLMLIALAFVSVRYLLPWLMPFVLGAGLAVLLRPFVLRMSRRLGLGEKSAALISLLLFYLAAASIPLFFIVVLLAQFYSLLLRLPEIYAQSIAPLFDRLGEWFYSLAGRFFPEAGGQMQLLSDAINAAVQQAAVDGSSFLVSKLAGLAAQIPSILLLLTFTIVISVLTSVGYRTVSDFIHEIVPPAVADFISRLRQFLRETLWKVVRAYTIIMAVTFAEIAAGLWLLGFDYALPVATIVALVDLLPLVGSGIVLVPWGIVLLASGDMVGGVGLLLLFGIIAVVRNIIEPKVVGSEIGLHPVATITAMYAGMQIGGLTGMLLAPVTVLAVLRLYRSEEL